MKTSTESLLVTIILSAAIAVLSISHLWQGRQWQLQISINQALLDRVGALDSENAGQWQRISEFEVYFCNPELIKCGK